MGLWLHLSSTRIGIDLRSIRTTLCYRINEVCIFQTIYFFSVKTTLYINIFLNFRLLLWDCDDRSYSYYIEVSNNKSDWEVVWDRSKQGCKSWQHITFPRRPLVLIRIGKKHALKRYDQFTPNSTSCYWEKYYWFQY